MRVRLCVRMHMRVCACTHVYIYTHIYTYTPSHTNKHINTCTHLTNARDTYISIHPEHLWVDGTHTAASEPSEALNLRVKPLDILINPNLPKGSPTSLLIKNKPIFIMVAYFCIMPPGQCQVTQASIINI